MMLRRFAALPRLTVVTLASVLLAACSSSSTPEIVVEQRPAVPIPASAITVQGEPGTPGGTLDVFPISSILPGGTDRMTVNFGTTPGTAHGTMYRVVGVDAYAWGSGAPNNFAPTYPNNRIFGGEGFRYVNNGTGDGTTESIPVTFRDSTGFTQTNDTIVITISSHLTPNLYLYTQAFSGQEANLASAGALVLAVIIAVAAGVISLALRRGGSQRREARHG